MAHHHEEEEVDPKERKIDRRITLAILIVTIVVFMIAFHPFWPVASDAMYPNDTIKVVVTMPFSSDQSEFGIAYARGVELAIEEINANGGIRGVPAEAIYYDNYADEGELRVEFFNAYDAGIPVVIGPLSSSSALVLAPYAEMFEQIVITPSATSPDLSAYDDYLYRTIPSDAYMGLGLAKIVVSTYQMSSVAIVYQDNSYGKGIVTSFEEEVHEIAPDTKITLIEIGENEIIDGPGIVSNISNAQAQAVLVIATSSQILDLLAAGEAANLSVQWFGTDNTLSSSIAAYGEYANGIIAVTPSKRVNSLTYEKKYEDKFGVPMTVTDSIYGYDTMMIIAQVIRDYGYSAKNIKKGLDSVRYIGLTGAIVFDKNGDRYPSYDVIELRDGTWVTLKWSEVLTFESSSSSEGHH